MPTALRRFILAIVLPAAAFQSNAQPKISGATCVMPGATYQYLITGSSSAATTIQACVTGGVIALADTPCVSKQNAFSSLLVVWNSGESTGGINVSSSRGNATLTVAVSKPLQAGAISDSASMQSVGFNLVPSAIYCGPDSGGACKPVYLHQWQQSRDNVHWADIPLATGDNLLLVPAQPQTIFFRRKTTEKVSGSIAYSNPATVMVGAPPPGTSAASMN